MDTLEIIEKVSHLNNFIILLTHACSSMQTY